MFNHLYTLLMLVLAFSMLTLYKSKWDILEPTNILNLTFLFSILMAVFNIEKWNLYIGVETTLIIISALLSFSFGKFTIDYIFRRIDSSIIAMKNRLNIYEVRYFIITAVILFFLFLSIQEIYNLSVSIGNVDGYSNMIKTVRYPLERQEIRLSRWMAYRSYFAQAFCYLAMYIGFYNIIYNNKFKFIFFYPVLLYIPFTILSTGRLELLSLFIYILVVFSVLYLKKEGYSRKAKSRIILLFFFGGILFLVFFIFYGYFTGKVANSERTPFVIISHYVGLSFPALDRHLNAIHVEDLWIGNNTLLGLYRGLRTFGFDVPEVPIFLEFTQFSGIDTNVYSAIRRYIDDYGIIGMQCIFYIFGTLFSFFYFYIKKNDNIIVTLVYACNVWTVALSFHDEKFFMTLLTTQPLYQFVLVSILLKLVQR